MPPEPSGARDAAAADEGAERRTVLVSGRVQGVGFRWWVRCRALELGLAGHVRNLGDGRVEIVAQGAPASLTRLVALLAEQPSSTGRPGVVESCEVDADGGGPPRAGVVGFGAR